MMVEVDPKRWALIREYHLNRFERARARGEVDEGLIPLIEAINSFSEDVVTTSSCYGRIVLIKLSKIGLKDASIFYRKWHRPVSYDELMDAVLSYEEKDPLWLMLQSTIIHIRCRSLPSAVLIRNLGLQAGYKYSKILSISLKGITVEVAGSERFDIPVKVNGEVVVKDALIKYALSLSHAMFKRIESRISRFMNLLTKSKSSK